MKFVIKSSIIISILVLMGCQAGFSAKKIGYLAVDMPNGPIHTRKNTSKEYESVSRVSAGFYRPPADVVSLLLNTSHDTNKVFRDVNVVMQTPMCYFPLLCMGQDQVIVYD